MSLLTTHILLYTLILITSLLVLLMMLWHISTAHLIDDYDMPQEWYEDFLAAQFPGWRIGIWALLFFMIPLNCVHALLCLDFYAGHLFPRGQGDVIPSDLPTSCSSRSNESSTATLATGRPDRNPYSSAQHRNSSLPQYPNATTSAPAHKTPTEFPQTYHPLLSPDLPRPLHILPSLYDVTLILLLVFHVAAFLLQLPSNLASCDWTPPGPIPYSFYSNPPRWNARLGGQKQDGGVESGSRDVSVRDRCVRINIDNWISGGFDVAGCFILVALHGCVLVCRVWECVRRRRGVKGLEDMGGD
ncbi:hypothetical protein K505DRAFT_15616 [Melanomma pulvis-pyrius CBS 109.77]|uniref:Uncharacterized protein n=1 Tax=Melanomma pulvis-pyrius CBS 109.77 TaxID=1314802 RepID=A0A6A6XG45_9PLEO|nr:hypothetical protein K505DRAFT_15616 [Melanomma pulvis-pyrius CBS 109.77]